jgi:hypothetical protein
MLVRRAPDAEILLEAEQSAADDRSLLPASSAGSALGVHRGADSLQRREQVSGSARLSSSEAASRSAYSACVRSSARHWISDHRASAFPAASAPGASATLITSYKAEPFA